MLIIIYSALIVLYFGRSCIFAFLPRSSCRFLISESSSCANRRASELFSLSSFVLYVGLSTCQFVCLPSQSATTDICVSFLQPCALAVNAMAVCWNNFLETHSSLLQNLETDHVSISDCSRPQSWFLHLLGLSLCHPLRLSVCFSILS